MRASEGESVELAIRRCADWIKDSADPSFPELYGGHPAQDRVRHQIIPTHGTHEDLNVIEEAFTSENWIVRIYAVKKEDPFGRSLHEATAFQKGTAVKPKPKTGRK